MSGLRIVVTGLAATFPLGGVFWDYMQYASGLRRLGHEVLYLEDTGRYCYDPDLQTFVAEGARNAEYLARHIAAFEPHLKERWFFRDCTDNTYGQSWARVAEFCRSADLFVHISASCLMRDEYFAASRVAFIDSDPMYTQASVPGYVSGEIDEKARARIDSFRRHDAFFTFGENVGRPGCLIPTDVFGWLPTRQPIVLDHFAAAAVPLAGRRRVLTTVLSWEPAERGPVVNGVVYAGKSVEFERFVNLPAASVLPLEVAMSGKAPTDRLRALGWRVVDAYRVSADPWLYRDYLAYSFGEWSVAKNAYVASRSGWFSCRSACYLALGVPVIVQDTGFGATIPIGEGVLAFSSMDQARAAIEKLAADPERHARAAIEIAREYFDSDRVLGRLIEQAMNGKSRVAQTPAPPGRAGSS